MEHIIDWTSVFLVAITWSQVMGALSLVAVLSTILYNGIRTYKELKKKK
jgi:amino acid transporter